MTKSADVKTIKKKKILITGGIVITFLAIVFAAFLIYVLDYYKADEEAIAAFLGNEDSYFEDSHGNLIFNPQNAKAGLIFYPGGKVDEAAYIPLMQELMKKEIMCVLLKVPFNLAVFDINAAEGVKEEYPEIENWYLGGHSLGGSMAASYLESRSDNYLGLILLGSYSTADLSDTSLSVLSIYGSEDKVLNKEKYNENLKNLPKNFIQSIISGGSHAYFGMYGEQKGDGTAAITNGEQIKITADIISGFCKQ